MFIIGPDGEPTQDWIIVRGTDSDAFQLAKQELSRATVKFMEDHGGDVAKLRNTPEYLAHSQAQAINLRVSLVIGWSFEEPANPTNIKELLTEAPYIGGQLDDFSGKREGFANTTQSVCEPTLPVPLISMPATVPPPPAQPAESN